MAKERYKIAELQRTLSSRTDGWGLIIFSCENWKIKRRRYVVLEGNRRVTAIREIMKDDKVDPVLKDRVNGSNVMEVLDARITSRVTTKEFHISWVFATIVGFLKKWTPFAQAWNRMDRYLEYSGQRLHRLYSATKSMRRK